MPDWAQWMTWQAWRVRVRLGPNKCMPRMQLIWVTLFTCLSHSDLCCIFLLKLGKSNLWAQKLMLCVSQSLTNKLLSQIHHSHIGCATAKFLLSGVGLTWFTHWSGYDSQLWAKPNEFWYDWTELLDSLRNQTTNWLGVRYTGLKSLRKKTKILSGNQLIK